MESFLTDSTSVSFGKEELVVVVVGVESVTKWVRYCFLEGCAIGCDVNCCADCCLGVLC